MCVCYVQMKELLNSCWHNCKAQCQFVNSDNAPFLTGLRLSQVIY
jgi:hypothetical protein